jgi:hypothetical protein
VNANEVARPDTAVTGLMALTVCAGSVTSITTGVNVPSRAAVYVPLDVLHQQTLLSVEPVPVAVVSKITVRVPDVSDVSVS